MNERVKIFAQVSGESSIVDEPELEARINQWLEQAQGKIVRVTQSESEQPGSSHHISVCVWYVPTA